MSSQYCLGTGTEKAVLHFTKDATLRLHLLGTGNGRLVNEGEGRADSARQGAEQEQRCSPSRRWHQMLR